MLRRFGQNLVALRKMMNITQLDLAIKLGVQPNTVSRWENGEALPGSGEMWDKVAEVFGCQLHHLVCPDPVSELKPQEPKPYVMDPAQRERILAKKAAEAVAAPPGPNREFWAAQRRPEPSIDQADIA